MAPQSRRKSKQNDKMSSMLARALQKAKAASRNGVVHSEDLDRGARERLARASFLTEVIRGWYLITNPAGAGTTTLWYSNYWEFIQQYLKYRFGENGYCFSAESSLDVFAAQNTIPQQLVVLTKKPSNQSITLLYKTSVLLYQDVKNFPPQLIPQSNLSLMPMADALCRAAPTYFTNSSLNAEMCLKLIQSSSDISRTLLEMQSPTAANRITGAYLHLGDQARADQIIKDLAVAGIVVRPENPFGKTSTFLKGVKLSSPYVGRIEAMWHRMRSTVIELFQEIPQLPQEQSFQKSLQIIEVLYRQDAYHSLSIEGYQVTEDMIQRIKEGKWSPDSNESDSVNRNALAAKGYLGAFKAVTQSVAKVLKGTNPGKVFAADLQSWYRELFTPLVQAQLIEPSALAGYRNNPVYISRSRHVPPPARAIPDAMEALEELLSKESDPRVSAVLGHFIFVFIHPYMDGNGRIARFLMNLILVSGGYQWTVIRTSERNRYMDSLEKASTQGEIADFTKLIVSEMEFWKGDISRIAE